MNDKNQKTNASTGTIRNSPSLPTPTTISSDSGAHVRLSNIFAPLIDLNASGSGGEQSTDYDSLTLRSLQSTMSSSSSSNPVSIFPY